MQRKLTRDVEGILGVPWWQLQALIRGRKIVPAPNKNAAGFYAWTEEDIARAREALKTYRPRRPGYRPQPAAG
jgi:hypothetical protein